MPYFHLTNEAYRLQLTYNHTAPAPISRLTAARNDSAAFQMVIHNEEHPYSVSIDPSDWYAAGNAKAGAHQRLRVAVDAPYAAAIHLEEYVTDDDGIEKADMLLNQTTRESRAGIPTAVWIEVQVPDSAAAGQYPVTVKLYSSMYGEDETCIQSETLQLDVKAHRLPDAKDWKFYLNLWQHSSNIARKHDVRLWSEEHFTVLKAYAQSLAALGQKSITVCVSEVPWSGQDCYHEHKYSGNLFEYSMIGIVRKTDGTYIYDYSRMQRYIDLCTEAGITGNIELFGLVNVWARPELGEAPCKEYPEALRIRYLDAADGCMKYMRDAEDIKNYIRALEAYFLETDQIQRARIAADEPGDVEKYRISLNLLKELAPSFQCTTAINHAEFIEEFHEVIDDFIPYLRCTIHEYDRLMQYRKDYPEKRFSWYVCCGGASPNTFIRTEPVESRMIGILTSYLKMDGFLRWAYTIWPDDPRHEIRYSAFEAGDTCFVYPGNNGGVLLSLRYKNLQRGIADYTLLEELRERKGDEQVDAMIKRLLKVETMDEFLVNNWWKPTEELFTLDWNEYDALKAEVLEMLQ